MLLIIFTTSDLVFLVNRIGAKYAVVETVILPLFLILKQIFLKNFARPAVFF
jgi:hypothetical protein